MLCALILYMSGGIYSLKSTLNYIFLKSFSWQFYLLLEFLPEICWKEVTEEIFSYFFVLMSDLVLNSDLTSNKRTQYLLDYGDFWTEFTCQISDCSLFTIDQILTLRQILEKNYEKHVVERHSIRRPSMDVLTALFELKIPAMLIRLSRMTISNCCNSVEVDMNLSEHFDAVQGFSQSDSFQPLQLLIQ